MIMVFAIVGGFAIGAFIGFLFINILAFGRAWSKTKRECRECLRTRVEYGFHVDGKEYKCVEVEKA